MTRCLWPAIAIAVCLGAGTTLLAQSFALRTGSWSLTMTIKSSTPMEGVPPEMRAQIEAQLSRPNTITTCITAEDLKNLRLGNQEEGDDRDCKTTSLKVTATTADITRQCAGDEPSTETSHFTAPTPTTLKGTVTTTTAEGTTTIDMTGKWMAAKCAENGH
jgi:hypothetical protein